jgi:hypothetical protein
VRKGGQAKLARQLYGAVRAAVVNQQHFVDYVPRQLGASLPQRPSRVVGGHNDKNALAIQHDVRS